MPAPAMLYRMLENDASEDDLTNALLRTYRVTDEPRARADVVAFLDLLADTGLLIGLNAFSRREEAAGRLL